MTLLRRALTLLGSLLLNPILLVLAACAFAFSDLLFFLFGRKRLPSSIAPGRDGVSIVIPNWNGRDLLEKYLSSVVAATAGNVHHEIIVVDNASTDGSHEFLTKEFPRVRVLALKRNLGFGGGSNAGFAAAKNDIVVLLNNDMRVEPDFLDPLVKPFVDANVFSVSCQIFLSDVTRRREETGLTESWWEDGRLKVSHREDPAVNVPFPCAYAGGGSSAFDRRKFLELGGFDELLRPFYYEDTDLGYLAWKRGWKLLYEPASVVFHEHRGTIGRKFSPGYIEGVLKKNSVLFCWKNIHSWRMLLSHLSACFTSSIGSCLVSERTGRYTFGGVCRAFLQLAEALAARWRARSRAAVTDLEAFRRQLGGFYWDRFEAPHAPVAEKLKVLFASPYPIEPPVHGGAVFMRQTLDALTPLADVHLVGFLDAADQRASQRPLERSCASVQFVVRQLCLRNRPSTLIPHAVREFESREFHWLMHRTIFLEKIDVVQLEYTVLGQYCGEYRHLPCMLFEHDIFFQSLGRSLKALRGHQKAISVLEYLRMLRYELKLLPKMTRVQVCSRENGEYLLGFLPALRERMDTHLRAGIQTSRYEPVHTGRVPNTFLFIGSFRHLPNAEALNWFTSEVLPLIVASKPDAVFTVVGADPPPAMAFLNDHPNIRLTGFVEDIRDPLSECSVFVCPILSGSGVRVKLLEAFASGIPAVSTTIGAEGLATRSGDICLIADTPQEFANSVLQLLDDPVFAGALAYRAREMVEVERDCQRQTIQLEALYQKEVKRKRPSTVTSPRALAAEQV